MGSGLLAVSPLAGTEMQWFLFHTGSYTLLSFRFSFFLSLSSRIFSFLPLFSSLFSFLLPCFTFAFFHSYFPSVLYPHFLYFFLTCGARGKCDQGRKVIREVFIVTICNSVYQSICISPHILLMEYLTNERQTEMEREGDWEKDGVREEGKKERPLSVSLVAWHERWLSHHTLGPWFLLDEWLDGVYSRQRTTTTRGKSRRTKREVGEWGEACRFFLHLSFFPYHSPCFDNKRKYLIMWSRSYAGASGDM